MVSPSYSQDKHRLVGSGTVLLSLVFSPSLLLSALSIVNQRCHCVSILLDKPSVIWGETKKGNHFFACGRYRPVLDLLHVLVYHLYSVFAVKVSQVGHCILQNPTLSQTELYPTLSMYFQDHLQTKVFYDVVGVDENVIKTGDVKVRKQFA